MKNDKRLTPEQLQAALCVFIGSEQFYRLYPNIILTEGVKFLCDEAQSYWLMDCLFSYQTMKQVAREPFQVLELAVNLERRSGLITLTDGNERTLFRQPLSFTDFPLASLKLYYTDQTVMLPAEY